MSPPPRSRLIDYAAFVESHGNLIPKDWPIEVRAGKIIIPQEHEGKSLRSAIIENTIPGNWAERRWDRIMDRFRPNATVSETLEKLDSIVAQTNRECTKIMGVRKEFNGPTVRLPQPDADQPFAQQLQYKILNLQLQQAGATVETPPADTKEQRSPKNRTLAFTSADPLTQGGDVLQHAQSNTLFVGIALNAAGNLDPKALAHAKELAKTQGMKLRTIPRVSAEQDHLNTMMNVLPDGSIIVMPAATNKQGMEAIYAAVDKKDVLEVTPDAETSRQALNLLTVNRHVFTPKLLPEMDKFLRARGFYPHEGFYETIHSSPQTQPETQKHVVQPEKKTLALGELDTHTLPKLAWSSAEAGMDKTRPVLVVHNKAPSQSSLG